MLVICHIDYLSKVEMSNTQDFKRSVDSLLTMDTVDEIQSGYKTTKHFWQPFCHKSEINAKMFRFVFR
jgi:hypothetical protein